MSGALTVTASADVHGPIFDGQAEAGLTHLTDTITQKIADFATRELRSFVMNKTGRAHGDFEENLHQVRRGSAIAIPAPMITGVTWGPWLEGVTQRNQSTGFGGYHLFRKTYRELDAGKAQDIADAEVAKYVAGIGGG